MNLTSTFAAFAGAGLAGGIGIGGKLDPLAHLDLAPSEVHYPFYFAQRESILPFLSDKYLSLAATFVIYWVVSLAYYALDVLQLPYFEQFRLHEPEEVTKRNKVSAGQVVRMVLVQQFIQTILGLIVLDGDDVSHAQVFADHRADMRTLGQALARALAYVVGERKAVELLTAAGPQAVEFLYWWGIPTIQLWWAFFVMDAWQYFFHRAFHESRWLYRNFHSHHHRLYVPYAFGALYNHPLEGLIFDSLGAAISHMCALMTIRQGIFLFTFATYKTVSDHCGYDLPWYLDPVHLLFPNTAAYHDVHHQMQGLRFNYSQPFFVHFDVLFGTRMSVDKFRKLVEGKKERREKAALATVGSVGSEASKGAVASSGIDASLAATAASSGSDNSALRARRPLANGNGKANGHASNISATEDASPAQILDGQIPNGKPAAVRDPLLTTSAAEYRAKAGSATA